MRRIIVLIMALAVGVIVVGGAALAVRATRGGLVVATVTLNGASGDGDMIADERGSAILVEDTITATSPAVGASQQPVLRMLDGADAHLAGIVPLVDSLDAPLVDRTTGRLLSLANLGGYGRPFAVTTVDLTRRTTLYTTGLPLPPAVQLIGDYGAEGHTLCEAMMLHSLCKKRCLSSYETDRGVYSVRKVCHGPTSYLGRQSHTRATRGMADGRAARGVPVARGIDG